MDSYYPPVSFYFEVTMSGAGGNIQASFKEVSGIEVSAATEEIKEGGQNNFTHKVPGRTTYSNLILKRGLAVQDSALVNWCKKVLQGGQSSRIQTNTIQVSLLDEATGNPVMTWSFNRAFPVKWKVSDFNAEESAIAIESVEFSYQDFKID